VEATCLFRSYVISDCLAR